jgi:hypothetical protein
MWKNMKRTALPAAPKQQNTNPINLSNPGTQGLTQLFGGGAQSAPLLPKTEEQSVSKFGGLKRYLKRSII